jgi:hypothetical protein
MMISRSKPPPIYILDSFQIAGAPQGGSVGELNHEHPAPSVR